MEQEDERMNKVLLHGRVAKEPDVKTLQTGQTVARLTIAVDRPTKDGERKADFIGCVAWGKTAEFLGKFFNKGKEILAEGRIQTGSYTDKNNEKRYTTDVVLDRVEFCGSKGGGGKADADEPFTVTDEMIPF